MLKKAKLNSQIDASYVILIDSEGTNQGKVSKYEALRMAESESLDLLVVDDQTVPICKIVDYGKMKFEQKKKTQKTKGTKDVLKQIWIGMNISDHDLDVKNKKVQSFLDKHYRVKYVLKLKGNNRNFTQDRVLNFFNGAISGFKEGYIVTEPVWNGNQVTSTISCK